MAVDETYSTGNFEKDGGNEWDIGNGTDNPGSLVVNQGGTLDASAGTLKLPGAGFEALKFVGAAAAGACTATGAKVGDRVLFIFGTPTAGGVLSSYKPGTDYEAVITVADEIQQITATDLHLSTLIVVLSPA